MTRATVALGSNLGDRLAYLRTAVEAIATLGQITAVSPLYETAPVGGPDDQGRFLNAVVVLETELDASDLLTALHGIERTAERVRRERWGPRTLDLDLITHGTTSLRDGEIEVPHPRAHERRFVLAPLADVSPDAVLADGRSASDALRTAPGDGITRWEGDWVESGPQLGAEARRWVWGQAALFALWLVATVAGADLRMSLISALGVVVTLAGAVYGMAAVRAFGPDVPMTPQPRSGQAVVDRGVYSVVRHPMYGAVVVTMAGAAVALRAVRGLSVAILIGVFFWFKSRREERVLSIAVPGYADYATRVRHRMVPFVL